MPDTIGVLIVDDSAIVRRALTDQLGRQQGITVLGSAPDPYIARDKIAALNPDVVILDIQLPRMDGLTFLKKLQKYHPVPVIVVSSLTQAGTETALECLENGAVDVLHKPSEACSLNEMVTRLATIIREIKTVRVSDRATRHAAAGAGTPVLFGPPISADTLDPHRVVVIGSSTGGTEALREVLSPLPTSIPGIVMAQHMPAGFTASFATRLDSLSQIEVREAVDGDRVLPGLALLAPGDRHVRLVRTSDGYKVRVADGPRVCRHKPSVEVLFRSAADQAGAKALGIILTGMGDDGADGLVAMRHAGAHTIGQDEDTCVVYGMPRAAFERGGVCSVLPLQEVPAAIVSFARASHKQRAA